MATVTYNGYTLPYQHGKITFETDNNVTVRFTTKFSIDAASVDTVMDTLKLPDKDFTIFGVTYGVTTTATRIKTRVSKGGLDADGGRYFLSLTVEVTLKDDKAGDGGLRDWSADLTTDEQGMKTVTVQGRYTGTSGGSGALANYTADIGALEAAVRSLYGGGTYNPARREIAEHDRFDNELRFQSIIVEMLEVVNVYNGSEALDTGIMFSKWTHSFTQVLARGHSDTPVQYVTVAFECLFERSFSTSVTDLRTRIAALMIKRLVDQFSASGVVLEREDRAFSSTNQSARGTWTFRVDNGPQFLRYDERIGDTTFYGGVEKITDGKPLTMASFSPGASMKLRQRVEAEYAGAPPGDPPPPSVAGVAGAVLIPEQRDRDRGITNFGTTDIGTSDQVGSEEKRYALTYSKDWWLVIPSPDDPDKTVVRPAQPG